MKAGPRRQKAMRPLLVVLLLAAPLLAGCASLDSARKSADELTEKLDDARRDLDEARERYDRVKSLQAVRTERAEVAIAPVVEDGILRFEVNATRDGRAIPVENLTRLPRVVVWLEGDAQALLGCDPLTCLIGLHGRQVELAWEDYADERIRVPGEAATLTYRDAAVLATTSVGDATE